MKMPVLFVGHGSPMNALETNSYTEALTRLGRELPRPRAIAVVSAHWESQGTKVTASDSPRTIHDFRGFPQALFDIRYPAPGSPELGRRIQALIQNHHVTPDNEWGLDHGAWAVLLHMYPKADIPTVQISLDRSLSPREHYAIGESLRPLRDEGVLLLSTGNITHNLRQVDFSPNARPLDWAVEFDRVIQTALEQRDLPTLFGEGVSRELWLRAVPSPEHYLPLLYTVGASEKNETPRFPYDQMQAGSLSMRSVLYGELT